MIAHEQEMKRLMRAAARASGMSGADLELAFTANLGPLRETDPARADRIQAAHCRKIIESPQPTLG